MALIRSTYPEGWGRTEVMDGAAGGGGGAGIGDFWGALLQRRMRDAERERALKEQAAREDLAMRRAQRTAFERAQEPQERKDTAFNVPEAVARQAEAKARIAQARAISEGPPMEEIGPYFDIGVGLGGGRKIQPSATQMTGAQRRMFLPGESKVTGGGVTAGEMQSAEGQAASDAEMRRRRELQRLGLL